MNDEAPQPVFMTTRELLELALRFHRRVKRRWARLQASSGDADAELLLGYICENEKRFVKLVSRYLEAGPDDLLDTFFQFAPEEVEQAQVLDAWRPEADTGLDAVLTAVLDADAFIENYYRRAAELSPREAVRSMFDGLADLVAEKRKAQAQNMNWLTDV